MAIFKSKKETVKVKKGEVKNESIKINLKEEDIVIVPEPVEEVEMYNGKRVIEKGEVEVHGVIHKTITTEEGSTYTL